MKYRIIVTGIYLLGVTMMSAGLFAAIYEMEITPITLFLYGGWVLISLLLGWGVSLVWDYTYNEWGNYK